MDESPLKDIMAENHGAERKIHTLETLLDFSNVLGTAMDLKTVFDAIMLTCMGEKGISITSIMLQESRKPGIFSIRAIKGYDRLKEKKLLKFSDVFILETTRKGYMEFEELGLNENQATVAILESLSCRIIIPVLFHGRLIAIMSCGPKIIGSATDYSMDDIAFLNMIASYSGIAISNLLGLDLLNEKKDDLEKKLFEMEALEETRRALTSTLDLDTLCHALLLSIMGYLKSESGLFYISRENPEDFVLMAKVGKLKDYSVPGVINLKNNDFLKIGERNFIRRETESVIGISGLLDSVNSLICFPLEHKNTFRALCFLGPKAFAAPFYRENELEQAVMLARQAIAPIRNSILHLELQINNRILKEAEQRSRKNETRLINILETSSEGFLEADFSGTVININQEVCRMLGLPKDKILNKNICHFISCESLSIVIEQLESRKKGKKGKYEASVISSSGEKVHCLISAAPIYENPDMSGDPSASFAMITDITRLKETEERLREFEKIVSASNDMIALIDRNHIHKTVNKAYRKGFGLPDSKVEKTCLGDVFGKMSCLDLVNQSVLKCLDGENVHFRHWFDLPGHGNKYLDVAFYPYSEKNDKPSAAIIVMRDVTEIKILETNLQQAQKMEAIGTLAGGIAHDFNNILSGILGYISLAQLFSENQTRDYLLKAQGSCQRAADLVRQILTFARKNDEDMNPFAIAPTVKETLKLIRASIPATINIKSDIEDTGRRITGNPTQIHQVLLNLCTNAVHAMEDSGGYLEITLKVYEWDDIPEKPAGIKNCPYFIMTVRDSGEGMPEEVMNRIFEPFFTTKKPGKGTGLGLSMSHGIVKSHGGEITVDSSPGCGTLFRVFFPVTSDASEIEKKHDQESSIRSGKERILFVDDEDAISEISILLLGNLGYHVTGFTEPSAAFESFRENPDNFDLVITDQTMPGMTGLELAARVKEVRLDMPVIICSGFSEQLTPDKIEKSGIDMYIIKPLTLTKLSESVRTVMDSRNKNIR